MRFWTAVVLGACIGSVWAEEPVNVPRKGRTGDAVEVDFDRTTGAVKPLHGVNNAPVRVAEGSRQDEFAAAGIPFVRTHDTAGMWGGGHYVDIPNVFPDFDADENDPANYDFAFTDAYLKPLVEAGCQPFYRLGVTIENYWKVKAYHIDPPKDFAKWARVCEHVVRHYNEGWANGFKWNLVYWEIWNEPENPPMWLGSREEFFELYRVTANHLKACFPEIRVGGYAGCGFYALDDAKMKDDAFFAGFVGWFEDFVKYVQDPKTKAPLDFFSWHLYLDGAWTVERIGTHADYVRQTLDAAGLKATESIFDEWNVFSGRAHAGFDAIKEPPAAARVMAAFALMQAGSVDKAMYYDALPTRRYCGLFYFPSYRTTPTYEAFRAFGHLHRLGQSVATSATGEGLYACAAKDASDHAVAIANVGTADASVDLRLKGAEGRVFRVYRLDARHSTLEAEGNCRTGERLAVPKDGFVVLTTADMAAVAKPRAAAPLNVNGISAAARPSADYPIRAAGLGDVKVEGGFWLPRLETNRLVTLKANFAKCNETPRIANFTNAANRAWGSFRGIYFDDSDVYKVMEGAAYIQASNPDPDREAYMTWLIGQMAKAQEPDGYLYTARLLGNERLRSSARWEELRWSHELYNQGHMIEAAVAWFNATGHTDFLDVARKSADLMCRTFGPGKTQLKLTSGHQEIELALGKLYRATGERRYLELAKFFLDMRGRRDLRPIWGSAHQDHLPVLEQDEAVGHCVRACYMYSGMADVAILAKDPRYITAIDGLWENVVGKKLHLNGGVGAGHEVVHLKWGKAGEAFGEDYELPNETAYLETCAAIANALWNERMFRIHGESKYVDVLERILYNGFLSGVSLSGDEFFYPNPLASKGGYRRSKWFGCSCCPVNDVRFIPQIPSFAFATRDGTLYWNLFMDCTAKVGDTKVRVETDYPWSGRSRLTVLETGAEGLACLKVRIPGWAVGRPVPSDLYEQLVPADFAEVTLAVNGKTSGGRPGTDGYVDVAGLKAGDVVTLDLPLAVKRIRAHEKVAADRGRLAVERGPIVYCAEGVDNGGKAFEAAIPADATFADDAIAIGDRSFPALKASNGVKLVPYFTWDHREPGNEMQVWFK